MTVNVVGIESGTAKKTGEAYMVAYVNYPRNRVQGMASDRLFLNAEFLSNPPKVGDHLYVDYDQKGYLIGFEVIKK